MSAIEWTDVTWNPTVGCRRISPGCANCYAEHAGAMVNRTQGKRSAYLNVIKMVDGDPRWTGEGNFLPDRLDAPLHWRKPRRVFVDSMSDLFYEKFTNEQIAAVFGVMAACPQHTFQILTKRPERMIAWFAWVDGASARSDWMRDPRRPNHAPAVHKVMEHFAREGDVGLGFQENVSKEWPLPNVWLGVSVEDRKHGVPRIDVLREVPAALRFLSIEPILEDVGTLKLEGIGWAIIGCESGAGMRPDDAAWYRSVRDQCAAAGVAFFLKQAVETRIGVCGDADNPNGDRPCGKPITVHVISPDTAAYSCGCTVEGSELGACVPLGPGDGSHRKPGPGNVIGAPYLDGVQHLAFPPTTSPATEAAGSVGT